MKQIIRKELRENLKFAAPAFVLLSLLLLSGFNSSVHSAVRVLTETWYQQDDLQPVLATSIHAGVTLLCCVLGAVLGAMQIYSERPVDRWSFLVHRPIRRTQLFFAKTIAGLSLYLATVLPPLVVFVAMIATSGHVAAPFEWAMVIPLADTVVSGAAFYFAAMLCVIRPAAWYRTKLFPLALPFLPAVYSFIPLPLRNAYIDPLVFVASVVIAALAVWGAFQRDASFESQPFAAKPATYVALLAGAAMIFIILAGLYSWLSPDRVNETSYYTMARDGDIYKVSRTAGEQLHVVDLKGNIVKNPKTGEPIDEKLLNQKVAGGLSLRQLPEDEMEQVAMGSGFYAVWRVDHRVIWYWTRHGVLLGFDALTRRPVGEIAAGSGPVKRSSDDSFFPPHDQFNSWNPARTIGTRRAVYAIDTQNQSATPVFTAASDERIGGSADVHEPRFTNSVAVLTSRRVLLADQNGTRFEYPLTVTTNERVSLYILQKTNFAIWVAPKWQPAKPELPTKVMWISREGKVTRNVELPGLRLPENESPVEKALVAVMPPAISIPSFLWHKEDDLMFATKNQVALSLIYGIAAAVLGWFKGRKYQFSSAKQSGWFIVNVIFGLPSLLAFLSVYTWPARMKCPSCGRPRLVNRDACEHCAAAFPPPEKAGVEIFAPLVKT